MMKGNAAGLETSVSVCAIIHAMDVVARFFTDNLMFVYFFYGLAFVGLGLVVLLESGRTSEFRFARALVPLALFGILHGAHEWFEMFLLFAGRMPTIRRASPSN